MHPDVKDDILMDLALLRSLATFAESRVASWRYLGLLDTAEVRRDRALSLSLSRPHSSRRAPQASSSSRASS